jgi:hypothetical protein
VLAARPLTPAEKPPLAPAGKWSGSLSRVLLVPVCQYSNQALAGPLLAVPRALSVALSPPTFVAGSVEA